MDDNEMICKRCGCMVIVHYGGSAYSQMGPCPKCGANVIKDGMEIDYDYDWLLEKIWCGSLEQLHWLL